MDLQIFLLFIALSSAVSTLWRSTVVFPVRYNYGWIMLSCLLFLIAGLGWLFIPDQFGYVVGGVWLLLFGIPILLSRLIAGLVLRGRYESARLLGYLSRALHPFDGWWSQPENIRATGLERNGQLEEATAIYHRLAEAYPLLRDTLTVRIYQLQGEWQTLIDDFEGRLNDPVLQSNVTFPGFYVRALGEVGRLNAMVDALTKFQSRLQTAPIYWNTAVMLSLAFSGERDKVSTFLAEHLQNYPEDLRRYWIAVADQAAGNNDEARETFSELLSCDDALIRLRSQERLARELPIDAETLTDEARAKLLGYTTTIQQDARYNIRLGRATRGALMTLLLVLANLVVFLVQVDRGGMSDPVTNIRVLYDLGALWASAVIDGEQWWRLVNAMFLHVGWLHIILNMLALMLIGGFVETTLGRLRFLLIYFASGVGASAMIVLLTDAGYITPAVTVGASGAIMGLFGATAAILLIGWRVERVKVARQYLTRIAVIIVIQAVIDYFVPQTSFTGHLVGAVIGFGVTLPLFLWMVRHAKPKAD
ncbi:MAG: rhomboid family intramembrane serine protease [Aggregatilineales bacterium]